MKKYVINGVKWFDKVNGNTYHNVRIIDVDSNLLIKESGLTYGYGEQWKQTAYDELVKLKKVKEMDRHNHKLNGKRFIYIVNDVQRKKDLWGERMNILIRTDEGGIIKLCPHVSIKGMIKDSTSGCEYTDTIEILCRKCKVTHNVTIKIN